VPTGELRQSVAVGDRPWHLYDFDLASLTAVPPPEVKARRNFSFGVALVWLGEDPADLLRYLGRADARFVREEQREGRRTLRYQIGGPAFEGALGGPLWLDSRGGFVVGAELGRPNHAEYRDFKLRLTGMSRGEKAWKRLLTAHFERCQEVSTSGPLRRANSLSSSSPRKPESRVLFERQGGRSRTWESKEEAGFPLSRE
jgi:hypothetical protein